MVGETESREAAGEAADHELEARTLTSRQAAALLNIRVESLYAYVSRGLIRSQPGASPRQRRYSRQDVEALARQRGERRRPERVLQNALHFGGPVLESSLTLIDDGCLYYRGRDVLDMLDAWSFEEAAAELWIDGGRGRARELFAVQEGLPAAVEALLRPLEDLPAVVRLQTALPLLAHGDPAAYDTRPEGVARTGGRLMGQLILIATGGGSWAGGVVETLQRAWGCPGAAAHGLLRAALILSLDHELNVSSFTARTTASAGAIPQAAVIAGLAALQGPKHGGHTRRVEALINAATGPDHMEALLADRLRRGESVPGFGQTLYPGGDPRCRELLRRVETDYPDHPAAVEARALAAAGWKLLHEYPTVDLALVAVARVLDLPPDSAITLFALGRSVGWIAHAAEQYQQRQLIRPRARYVGPTPPRRVV